MNDMFRDAGDVLAHIEDSLQSGEFEMSNRKPFNDRAGYVASRKNSLTGIHNVIYIAAEQGIDADGKYVTVCEAHGQMVSSASIQKARIDMKDASQWCSKCQMAGESSEDRLERQAQAHLEAAALHRDDPMF